MLSLWPTHLKKTCSSSEIPLSLYAHMHPWTKWGWKQTQDCSLASLWIPVRSPQESSWSSWTIMLPVPIHSPSCFPRWLFCTFHSLLKYLTGPPLFSVSFYWGSRGDQMRSSTRSHTHTHHLLASVSSNSAFLPVTEWVSPLPGKANPFPHVLDPICFHLLKNITLEISSLSPTATTPVPNASHQLTNI